MSRPRFSRTNRSRSRSRSPRRFPDKGCTLYLGNIPSEWDFRRIKGFIQDNTTSSFIADNITYVDVLKTKSGNRKGACLVKFSTAKASKAALNQLMGIDYNGRKIIVIEDITGNLKEQLSKDSFEKSDTRTNASKSDLMPLLDVSFHNLEQNSTETEVHSTYGLSLQYLESLNIQLPLVNSVFIVNLDFKVDEAKLTEVFKMAGQIINVCLYKQKDGSSKGMAHIEYDHPVEAVQAVAMFNLQLLYDREMSVRLDRSEQKPLPLPVGLRAVGAGLGPNGTPLRGVRNYIELQPLQQLLQKNKSRCNSPDKDMDLCSNTSEKPSISNLLQESNVNPTFTALNTTVADPISTWMPNAGMNMWNANMAAPAMGMGAFSNFNAQNLMQLLQQGGMNLATLSAFGNPMTTTPLMGAASTMNMMTGKTYGQFDSTLDSKHHEPSVSSKDEDSSERRSNHSKSDMVMVNNLPSTVTLTILRDKMREVGDLKFAEMTGQGSAIVRFLNSWDAERCVKIFDRSRVDGQIIEVKFF